MVETATTRSIWWVSQRAAGDRRCVASGVGASARTPAAAARRPFGSPAASVVLVHGQQRAVANGRRAARPHVAGDGRRGSAGGHPKPLHRHAIPCCGPAASTSARIAANISTNSSRNASTRSSPCATKYARCVPSSAPHGTGALEHARSVDRRTGRTGDLCGVRAHGRRSGKASSASIYARCSDGSTNRRTRHDQR